MNNLTSLDAQRVNSAEPARETPLLGIRTFSDVVAEVDAMPAPSWLARPVWPAGDYGIVAAEDKAGKSFAIGDLAISKASGSPWLGAFPCDTWGGVLAFFGEGGQRKLVRRLRAIAEHKGIAVWRELPLRLCFRVPHLANTWHRDQISEELEQHPAALVIVDPLYLAAQGARGSDLYEMGAHLEGVQHVAQQAGAALVVVTHFRKQSSAKGPDRITGVGPGAWGRVLATAGVKDRRTDPTGRTDVTLAWHFRGDEIPDTELTIRRSVWADDPDDLASRMHYEVAIVENAGPASTAATAGLSPAAVRVLEALRSSGEALTVQAIGDLVRRDGGGFPLKARTIQTALATLADLGHAVTDIDPDDRKGQRMRGRAIDSACAVVSS